MSVTTLRKVGGSVMLTISPALLAQLDLGPDSSVRLTLEEGRLVIEPHRPKYTLSGLLAASDFSSRGEEDREWLDAPAAGRELL